MGLTDLIFGGIVVLGLWFLGRNLRRFWRKDGPCGHCTSEECPFSNSKT